MSISLTYTKKDGTSTKVKFTNDVTEIRIGHRGIFQIDLTPLSTCRDLRILTLARTSLSKLDLSPLSSCYYLEDLYLYENQLQTIDLHPLTSCSFLERLIISDNHLQSIDLSPLSSSSSLEVLRLDANQLQTINLQPLASCKKFKHVDLCRNQLTEIDLSPLESCRSISRILVGRNPIQHIDLAPLSSAHHLLELDLYRTHLKSLDMTPLSSCVQLQALNIFGNQIEYIDLSPLSYCKSLQELRLFDNPIREIDLTPLTACKHVGRLLLDNSAKPTSWLRWSKDDTTYERPSCRYPWNFLHWVTEFHGTDYRVQQDVLVAMGLGEYGFIDKDLRASLLSIPSEVDLKTARNQIIPTLVQNIVEVTNNGGTSIGLDIVKVSIRHPEIAAAYPRIVELRKQELEQLIIGCTSDGTIMNLRELWLTAYGFEILNSIKDEMSEDSSITVLSQQFEPVKQAFAEMGIKLKLGKTLVSGNTISEPLKKAILWIIENEHKPWEEIVLSDSQMFKVPNLYE